MTLVAAPPTGAHSVVSHTELQFTTNSPAVFCRSAGRQMEEGLSAVPAAPAGGRRAGLGA
jgi:hypothetical protein